MAYKIEKKIIPGLNQGNLASANLVIAHDSGNPHNTGSNSLENEVRYMTEHWRTAFTSHWVGSGGRIVQLAQTGKVQYGAGPIANPYAYAQVELARTDNLETFKKDYKAYVWLLRKLAEEANIPHTLDSGSTKFSKGIKTHNWVKQNLGGTTHTDPYSYLASFGVTKEQFKKDIEEGGEVTVTPPKQQTGSGTVDKVPISNLKDKLSLVDYLKSITVDSSFTNRQKLAKEHGISGYTGTAAQNVKLLNKLKVDQLIKKPVVKVGDMKTSSIVTYLDSLNINSSYANRAKLALQYGIQGYKGTAAQNTKLLNTMRNKIAGNKPKINTTSIVDYLKKTGQDSSFANRKRLATMHGIKDYKGTASQNTKLLNILNK